MTGVFGGLISMRRSSGKNWFWVEEMQKRPVGPIGACSARAVFCPERSWVLNNELALLATRPRLLRVVREAVQRSGVGKIERSYLERTDDLPQYMGLDMLVAALAARFDGTETLETHLKQLASEQKAPLDRAISEGLRGSGGLLIPVFYCLDRATVDTMESDAFSYLVFLRIVYKAQGYVHRLSCLPVSV